MVAELAKPRTLPATELESRISSTCSSDRGSRHGRRVVTHSRNLAGPWQYCSWSPHSNSQTPRQTPRQSTPRRPNSRVCHSRTPQNRAACRTGHRRVAQRCRRHFGGVQRRGVAPRAARPTAASRVAQLTQYSPDLPRYRTRDFTRAARPVTTTKAGIHLEISSPVADAVQGGVGPFRRSHTELGYPRNIRYRLSTALSPGVRLARHSEVSSPRRPR